MMPVEKRRKADVVTSICLMALGSAVIYGAADMPLSGSYGGVTNVWYVSPAVFPFLVGGLLIGFSLIVLSRAVREGGLDNLAGFFADKARGLPRNVEVQRILLIWLTIGVYVFLLFGRIDFYLAGALFLLAFMGMFYRPPQGTRFGFRHILLIVGLSVLVPVVTGYVFSTHLFVPLP